MSRRFAFCIFQIILANLPDNNYCSVFSIFYYKIFHAARIIIRYPTSAMATIYKHNINLFHKIISFLNKEKNHRCKINILPK